VPRREDLAYDCSASLLVLLELDLDHGESPGRLNREQVAQASSEPKISTKHGERGLPASGRI
jgi:hypothetical protein